MSYFGGFTTFTEKQYHTYTPDSIGLKNIGLASYTRNSIAKFGYNKDQNGRDVMDSEIIDYFGSLPPVAALTDGNIAILYYDKDNSRYIQRTGADVFQTPSGNAASTLREFQTKWDQLQRDELKTEADKYKVNKAWLNIKNSLSGCITFKSTVNILGCSETPVIKVHFYAAGKVNDDRNVAFRGLPVFCAEPKNAALAPYAAYDTANTPPGQSIPAKEGGSNNPDNTVAAQPEYKVNNVTGKMEFGTFQLICRLLSDLDAANVPALPKDVDLEDFNDQKIKNPPSCDGMPMMAHNSNPREFGPNSFECSDGKKQKVRVVNLTPRAYKRGEMVLCSYMDGMWVPLGYANPDVKPPRTGLVWRDVQKYIVDSYSYFKDDSGLQNQNIPKGLDPSNYSNNARVRYYSKLVGSAHLYAASGNNPTKLVNLNLGGLIPDPSTDNPVLQPVNGVVNVPAHSVNVTNPQIPNNGYKPVYDTDVLSSSLGGVNSKTRLFNTNTSHTDKGGSNYQSDTLTSDLTTFSFGVYSIDGYKSSRVSRLRGYTGSTFASGEFNNIITAGTFNINEQSAFQINTGNIAMMTGKVDLNGDSNLKHFPLQLAIHSKDNPILNANKMYEKIYAAMTGQTVNEFANIMRENKKAISTALLRSDYQDVYGLEPVSPHRLQFTPLGTYSFFAGTSIGSGPGQGALDSNSTVMFNGEDWKYYIRSLRDHLLNFKYPIAIGSPSTFEVAGWDTWTNYNESKPVFAKMNDRMGLPDRFILNTLAHRSDGTLAVPTPYGAISYNPKTTKPMLYPNFWRYMQNTTGHVTSHQNTSFIPIGNNDYPGPGMQVVGIVTLRGKFKGQNGLSFSVHNYWGNPIIKSLGDSVSYEPISLGTGALTNIGVNANISKAEGDKVFYGNDVGDHGALDEMGTLKLFAKIFDHCPDSIYDGRYFTPLFFNPDSGLIFETVTSPAPGAVVTKGTKITRKLNPIRHGKLLNEQGFLYIKNVIGGNPNSISVSTNWKAPTDPNDTDRDPFGQGYQVGDVVYFGGNSAALGAQFEVTDVTSTGAIKLAGLKMIHPGDYADGSFEQPLELSNANENIDGDPQDHIIHTAHLEMKNGLVTEIVLRDPPPIQHGAITLTPDDNGGYGYTGRGSMNGLNTGGSLILQDSEYNKDGYYDLYLFFYNDVGIYAENSSTSISTPMSELMEAQFLNLEITTT